MQKFNCVGYEERRYEMQQNVAALAGLPMHFGDFGGILVPDAFTPDFFSFAARADRVVRSEEFKACMAVMLEKVPAMEVVTAEVNGKTVQSVRSQALYYMVAGHLALETLLESRYHYTGMTDEKLACFAAEICREHGMHCLITLDRRLSEDAALKERLAALGAEIDDATCAKLYDRPQAYAFQRYLGDREHSGFIPVGTSLGAYPYPALGGYFGSMWGEKLRTAVKKPDLVAATMLHGNAAVAAFRAFPDCRLATVEQPICQQYHGEFCGCSLLMVRTAKPREYSVTIAPELADMWRMAKVVRLGTEDYCEASPEAGLSASAVRAVDIISRRLPEAEHILVVEGEDE